LRQIIGDNRQDLEVTDEAFGNYQVHLFYNDLSSFPLVTQGYYDIVFLCCVYDASDAAAVGSVVNAVKGTKTKIVLFPVENEVPYPISTAFKTYDCGLADWRNGIRALYKKGFTGENLRYDDGVLHTNELGGFFGACVIYSYLYHKKPDVTTAFRYVTNNYSHFLPAGNQNQSVKTLIDTAYDVVFDDTVGTIY